MRFSSRRPSKEYSRMFSALAAGMFLVLSGAAGWDVRGMHGFFHGARWQGGPIWIQIALGLGLLLLGAFWLRRLPGAGVPRATARVRIVKNAGSGRTRHAAERTERPQLTAREPNA
jgi:hypothetical protein